MNHRKKRAAIALVLIMVMVTGCGSFGREKTAPKVTAGELAEFFLEAASKYVEPAERVEVLAGMKESEEANRLQMLVLAGRAFGKLPKLEGNAEKMAPHAPELSEIPDWAREALENLAGGGILAETDLNGKSDGEKKGKEQAKNILKSSVTMKDAKIIAARFYTLFGTNEKDDFYTAVNHKMLNTTEIPKTGETTGGSSDVTDSTDKQLAGLIDEIVNSGQDYPKGSPQQKIRDFYKNFVDTQSRSQVGLEPLQKYLDAVDKAASFSELNKAIAMSVNELGTFANGLFPGIPTTDTKDSSRKILLLMTMTPGLEKGDYGQPEKEEYKEYRASLVEQLLAVGESQEKADYYADAILKLENDIIQNIEEQDDSGQVKEQKYYTLKKLDEMMPQAKPSELLSAIGVKDSFEMQVLDDKMFLAFAKWFTEDNLGLFKAIEKVVLLNAYSPYLGEDLAERFGATYLTSGDIAVQTYLSEELGQLYVERYFSAESKEEIKKMTEMMIETFKKRMERLDWLEENTKKEAIKKLDSLTVLIGYPDEWQLSEAEIRGPEDGGSLFENAAAFEVEKWKRNLKELEEPVDNGKFALAAYTVNAAANRNTNVLLFPAGILQAPFYDKDASFEANLGAIGSTIAHEITHMFDDGGAQFDSRGNLSDWWAKKDYEHFRMLCKKAEEFYDGHEAAPGIKVNGQETLSENIADIGGIACGLEILSNMENPDYDAFFRSYAKQWLRVADYDTLLELAESDMHAPNNLRSNLVLSNFQEFYDTYDIKPGDGMYVAPEDRIKIW
ncbi:M13 family metallopeptidase [Bariatricus massiliensis]|uniref:M13 family metallopeptidase n=1 Tax=Bariatricus massiliensis TaxID=1745713 RepID=A0ABS8DBA4_9FIRM|nr:M13 family metallopeptidase [Bariatricus massiliensis]MCB7303608.1 M13 family metallopeptidase [Bariatricus massiliensis]MCB7373023.1 M13 family metallopeptidase [Bariatricus massiliensis]MCB7385693.1 M13 family metallopeptidase [Bariatricus massiliensis]MCB7409856.1 M13 family metallopeptidase [Bariatricus massiliensis]MCQ5254034.1 M13 family metallopeptidase [Bariatricus massiliensis]